eukprot:364015-Pelagomonas_calceolata.AAC.4
MERLTYVEAAACFRLERQACQALPPINALLWLDPQNMLLPSMSCICAQVTGHPRIGWGKES